MLFYQTEIRKVFIYAFILRKVKAAKSDTAIDVSPKLIKEIEEETEKISTLRLVLAKKNRHVYALQRKLDDIPSRAELAQYQKRFIELYNQGKSY